MLLYHCLNGWNSTPTVMWLRYFTIEKVPSLCSLSFMNVSEAKSQGLLQQNIIEAILESILISASLLDEKKLHMLWRHVDCSLFISKKKPKISSKGNVKWMCKYWKRYWKIKLERRVQFLSDLARRTLDCRAEKIPEMLEHKRNGKIPFMLMDKLIVYDKPPDTDRRGIGNIANVPDHENASESHASGNVKIKQN